MTHTLSTEMLSKEEYMLDHVEYLSLALHEAEEAFHRGDIPVGAVLVDDEGNVLASSRNASNTRGGRVFHAEIALLLDNQALLSTREWTCTLYSSLEPCIMCLGTAIISHIKRIAWAADDYWAGGTCSFNFASQYLRSQPVEFISPMSRILQQRSVELMRAYLQTHCPEKVNLILGKQILEQ